MRVVNAKRGTDDDDDDDDDDDEVSLSFAPRIPLTHADAQHGWSNANLERRYGASWV